MAASAALLVLLGVALVRFLHLFRGESFQRFAYLPIGLIAAGVYAAWRVRRALRKFRDAATR
jgi:membrane protein DedA with SNARE-associated domain